MLAVVLLVALRYGRIVSAVVDSPDREVFLLKVLGAALLVAGFASALQVSAAVGAFLLGIAISGSTAENAARLLEPLRDLFAAVFFAGARLGGGAGRLDDPHQAGDGLVGRWAVPAPGGTGRRGELSIVIAGLAVGSGAVDGRLAALATTYVLLMAVIGPVAARVVEPVAPAGSS